MSREGCHGIARSAYALMVYGVGDGGAGPGEEHIERLTRIRNIDGLPHVDFSRVDKFFTHADAFRESLPIISGELYFEAHQGCFTSESYHTYLQESYASEFLSHPGLASGKGNY